MAFVQANNAQGFGGSDPLQVTLTGVTAGNSIVGIACCDDGGAGTFGNVTDSQGNTYTKPDEGVNNGVRRAITFCAGNVTGGSVTISADLDTTHGNWIIIAAEYSGRLASANPIDNSGASHIGQIQAAPTTATDAATSTAKTTVTAGCDIVGLTANTTGASLIASAGTGFTSRQSNSLGAMIEDKLNVAAGSNAATFTLSANSNSFTAMIALQPAAAPTTPSLDGSVHGTGSANTLGVTLTTSKAGYVIAIVETNGGPVTGVSSPTLGAFSPISSPGGGGGGMNIEVWAKWSTGAISETVTVNTTNNAFLSVDAFGVKDTGQTSLVWDAGGPQVSGGPDPIGMTVASANAFAIAAFRMNSTPTPSAGSGWTSIFGANYMQTEWKLVTAGSISATLTTGAGDSNGAVIIAIPYTAAGGAPARRRMTLLGVG